MQLSGVVSPNYKYNLPEDQQEHYATAAKFFTECCLLNRDVDVVLEGTIIFYIDRISWIKFFWGSQIQIRRIGLLIAEFIQALTRARTSLAPYCTATRTLLLNCCVKVSPLTSTGRAARLNLPTRCAMLKRKYSFWSWMVHCFRPSFGSNFFYRRKLRSELHCELGKIAVNGGGVAVLVSKSWPEHQTHISLGHDHTNKNAPLPVRSAKLSLFRPS